MKKGQEIMKQLNFKSVRQAFALNGGNDGAAYRGGFERVKTADEQQLALLPANERNFMIGPENMYSEDQRKLDQQEMDLEKRKPDQLG